MRISTYRTNRKVPPRWIRYLEHKAGAALRKLPRRNSRKVTAKDIQRVAQEYLHPDQLVFLIVGKWEDIEPGDADGRATMGEFNGGKSTELPLRDPLTLEPMP